MVPEWLEPNLDLLREEYVLVQAWKKTASYIRYHNWYADTLALDRAAVNLPAFIGSLQERLQVPAADWRNEPLRIVPAPKSQRWGMRDGAWGPIEKHVTATRLRPLAHVDLANQVIATAFMLCLADRVETRQGDPRPDVRDQKARRNVVSYGNRLFCDAVGEELRHRWGSSKLYRAYYQDYRTFLSRPQTAAESISAVEKESFYVVHSDLRQFYDRVRPGLLGVAVDRFRREGDDAGFFSLAKAVFDWGWDSRDDTTVGIYAGQAGLDDFTRVALPQGLVASGFFANVVLQGFDDALRAAIGTELAPGIRVEDACRYVDDLRILIASEMRRPHDIERAVFDWMTELLTEAAPGLVLSSEKTKVAALYGDGRPLVRQSAKMARIQTAVSGGFDALAGEEILDSIQGLMRSQEALDSENGSGWRLAPVPDVRDATVARFGAARYRTTFRSIRPLLQSDIEPKSRVERPADSRSDEQMRVTRTQRELDDETRAFALGLIQRWVEDPSNVRLLRVGLDLWPDVELLREVLLLLRPFTGNGGLRKAPRRVAWYCLAEVLRAGATETGFVADSESLPSAVDLETYRAELCKEAVRLAVLPAQTVPWYVRQQAFLLLAVFDPRAAPVVRTGIGRETRHYRELIRYLRGEGAQLRCSSAELASLAVIARRSFRDRNRAVELALPALTGAQLRQIAQRDPSFVLELVDTDAGSSLVSEFTARLREDLCLERPGFGEVRSTLASLILGSHGRSPLRSELSLLHFAKYFLEELARERLTPDVITPVRVELEIADERGVATVVSLRILGSRADTAGSLYGVPSWCNLAERWRFQLGFLLRFILSGQPDFTRSVRSIPATNHRWAYRPTENHWYQRSYGLYNGQSAFGDDWLPITDWMELFLLALLRWPGCRRPVGFDWVGVDIGEALIRIAKRISDLELRRGSATGALILPLLARRPDVTSVERPLRACVVQTAIPVDDDFRQPGDLTLGGPAVRKRHRNHLSAALAAVERMLTLRATHTGTDERLDWLILPELAVHPDDVRTHLVPFARAHRTMVLAGLTYQELFANEPLINSALWIIPEWTSTHGLQIRTRRQGKAHLAPNEQAFNNGSGPSLQGFRPCQWLIGYPWCRSGEGRPVWLAAAVCYDATDLGLAADLRNVSDVLAIPALNKDVKTFDQMALALHYHMFQLVIVANNGRYGGSNAYWPLKDSHLRQVFHTHGQPQASIAFLEINDIRKFLERRNGTGANAGDWKYPPAGVAT